MTEAKGGDFASSVAGMKKAEAAAYAERQIGGTGWLRGVVRIADLEPCEAEDDDSELMETAE